VVGITAGENLCLRFQAAKSASMDDTIAVALKVVAVGMRRLGMAASAGLLNADRIVGEHGKSLAVFEQCLDRKLIDKADSLKGAWLKRLRKKSNFDSQPLKGRLISKDLRHR
jgi:hypothetical protein